MNPGGILALIIAFIVVVFTFQGGGSIFGNGGTGPIATGPGSSSEIRNPQPVGSGAPSFGGGSSSGTGNSGGSRPATPAPGESPFKGVIRIASVERGARFPSEEYIVIRHSGYRSSRSSNTSPYSIDVTGWRVQTLRAGETIPRALNIPEVDTSERDIILPPGGELIMVSGSPAYSRNFRENRCVGYFTEATDFRPFLSSSCAERPDRSVLLRQGFNGACIDAIESVPVCRMPRTPFPPGIKDECIQYMMKNFNYSGCVANERDQKDFLRDVWRVSMKSSTFLFDSRHDHVVLRDGQGLLVDTFDY